MSFRFATRICLVIILMCIATCLMVFFSPLIGNLKKHGGTISWFAAKPLQHYSSQYLPRRPLLTSEKRLSNLNARCAATRKQSWSNLTLQKKQIVGKRILVNDEHRILYCNIPKVACSNWKRVLTVLSGNAETSDSIEKVDHKKFVFLSDLPPLGIERRLQSYYKFIFVREPLERLVSAYRDKFLRDNDYFRKRWGSKIVKRFRKKSKPQTKKANGNVPTLNEFFSYVIRAKPAKMDPHWMPFVDACQPCAISYDFVGSFDTLQRDADRVLRNVHAPDNVHFPKRQKYYSTLEKNNSSFDSLISQVPRKLLKKVVRKYIKDYELFSFPRPKF